MRHGGTGDGGSSCPEMGKSAGTVLTVLPPPAKFEKPGARPGAYFDYALEAATKALLDANVTYDQVEFAAVGYCFGGTGQGQRALYQLGLSQIPIVNTNNACAVRCSSRSLHSGPYD